MIKLPHLLLFISAMAALSLAQDYGVWYAQSEKRIDSLRKGNFRLAFLDAQGKPVPEGNSR